jgi:hypothetical protein
MELTASTLKFMLSALKVAPPVYEQIQVWRGKPKKAERELLVRYLRRLDERRVFSAPFNVEVVELCIGSLRDVIRITDDALADLAHPAARAIVGSVLDCTRQFLDDWGAFQTPRRWEMPRSARDDEEFPEFFKDLGELRGRVKILVAMLTELEPRATAATLCRDAQGSRS